MQRWLPLITGLGLLAACRRAPPPDPFTLSATVDSALTDTAQGPSRPIDGRMWVRFDSAVAAMLAAGLDAGAINGVLSEVAHFAPAGGDSGRRIGTAVFYREPPRAAPSWYVAQLGRGRARPILGVFDTPRPNGPSHLALFTSAGGAWRLADSLTSDRQLVVAGTHGDSAEPFLGALETWLRADGSESRLRLWWVRGGRLVLEPYADTAALQDAEIVATDTSLEVWSAQFPRAIEGCTMCSRLQQVLTIRVAGGRVSYAVTAANPWVHVVDRFFAASRARDRAGASALVADPLILSLLWGTGASVQRDDGSLRSGTGTVDVLLSRGGAGPDEWALTVSREDDGAWRIAGARKRGAP